MKRTDKTMIEWMRGTTGKQRGVVLPIVAVITLLALGSITHVAYAMSNITKLTSPKPELFGHFGQSVAITENDPLVVVGAPQESADMTTEASGHAYVFDATTGTPISTLTTPSSQLSGNFGY